MNETPDRALYLYGFTQPDLAPQEPVPAGIESAAPSATSQSPATVPAAGIDGEHRPFLWRHAGSTAIVSSISKEEFCGATADSNLQNVAWVSPRVLRHQAVLKEVMGTAAVLPARFATLFSSFAMLGQLMEDRRETIARLLERVASQEEWALKAFLHRTRAEEELFHRKQAEGRAPAVSSPGLTYLREQQLRLEARQDLEMQIAAVCNGLLGELTPLASEFCSRPLLSPEASGSDAEMLGNWALLVPQTQRIALQEQVEQVNASQALPGLTFTLSGPWPPYSFCPALAPE